MSFEISLLRGMRVGPVIRSSADFIDHLEKARLGPLAAQYGQAWYQSPCASTRPVSPALCGMNTSRAPSPARRWR